MRPYAFITSIILVTSLACTLQTYPAHNTPASRFIAPVLSAAPVPTAALTAVVCVSYRVNFRAAVGTQAKVLSTLPNLTPITITGKAVQDEWGYDWYPVRVDGVSGFLYSRYICY